MTRLAPIALSLIALTGCEGCTLPAALGEQCQLNSDCDAPLVCRLGYCRKECSTSRDCAAGLDCVYDTQQYGSCQLPSETHCVHDSDCPASLRCTMQECTNECNCADGEPCRDCPPGAACIGRDDGSRACIDTSTRNCVWDSDCEVIPGMSFVCAFDQRCRVECRSAADCRFGGVCAVVPIPDEGVMGNFCIYSQPASSPDAGADGG